MADVPAGDRVIAFGPYRFHPARRLLLEGEEPVALGSRAMDILLALLERRGEVVPKEVLLAQAWPNTVVDEGSVRVQVALLRRALRDGQEGRRFIVTNPGRGYSFAAPVTMAETTRAPPAGGTVSAMARAGLPTLLGRVIGRAEPINTLAAQLRTERLLTIVGPGGIGKTTVAIAAARQAAAHRRGGAVFLDLSSISDPALVPSALALALGLTNQSAEPMSAICAVLEPEDTLLLIDNCEHVVEAVATLVERILGSAPGIHILATSREPLRAAGERVCRLSPLAYPPDDPSPIDAARALGYSSVALFVERAADTLGEFELLDKDAPSVAAICRMLDGIALAIELAARRVDAFPPQQLAVQLSDCFRLLTRGRRTALPRHQTLDATLEWSYRLLSPSEQRLLRQLAMFAGTFSIASAAALASGPGLADVPSLVADLVAKSLLQLEGNGAGGRYRMLETMRLFGLRKLTSAGELGEMARRHADHFGSLLTDLDEQPPWTGRPSDASAPGSMLADTRAALDWAFSAAGDAALGVALTVKAVPLWIACSLALECRDRVERALAHAAALSDGDAHSSMVLNAGLGWSLMYTAGSPDEVGRAWMRALADAERCGDTTYRLRSLWGLWIHHLNAGAFRIAIEKAEAFHDLAVSSADGSDLVMADRMLGTSRHFAGEQNRAAEHLERAFDHVEVRPGANSLRRTDRRGTLRWGPRSTRPNFLARVTWLRGQPEHAMRLARDNVAEALAFGNGLSLVSALGQGACPIALWSGDLSAAEGFAVELLEHATRHGLKVWGEWARCVQHLVLFKLGDGAALRVVQAHLSGTGKFLSQPRYLPLLAEYALALGQTNATEAGLATIERVIERSEINGELWLLPELLRTKAELLRRDAPEDEVRAVLNRGFTLAERQGALSWALRLAVSLARLRPVADAQDLDRVRQVYERFTEGFDTHDLRTARSLIGETVQRARI